MELVKNQEKIKKIKERAKALVEEMTLEEKVFQMVHTAPAIGRLHIKSYNWWNEGLHGVARAGVATVFPQAISMAAAFDPDRMEEVGDAVSTEARAKFNMQQEFGDTGIYKGLTFWAPNVNIFRDPRWGRGHETYGEDPYLTSRLAVRFIEGMQGHHEEYLKVAACAKHFAVHSGPEDIRHEFNAEVSKQDLYETYLPAFEACVKEAKVEAVMGAYNRTNGEPCCGSKTLLKDILRDKWGFDGHVTSDCWAIRDFYQHHCVTKTPEESVALAVRNGCDLNCGNLFTYLLQTVEQGLITEEEIDRSVIRLFSTRIKLGLFDGTEKVPFNKIPYRIVDSKEMRELNRKVARECLVLLKNENHLLPLKKSKIKTLGIIGPNANNRKALVGNYEGTASRYVTLLEGFQDYLGDSVRIFYSEGCHLYQEKIGMGEKNNRIAEIQAVCKESDIVIACMGLDPGLEGEAGDQGNHFASGDKPNLLLPGVQEEVLKIMVECGKPVILLLNSGSALAVDWAQEHVPAIMQCWYPGAEGGRAVAEAIFGEYSPSGKLPVTFYKRTQELPEFTDYSMKERTYRYLTTEPLYPFGYGLSYTEFELSGLKASIKQNEICTKGMDISVTVKNTGHVEAKEIVQVYIKAERKGTPNAQLKAFKKVSIKPAEAIEVVLHLSPDSFALCNQEGEKEILPGEYSVFVGDTQPDSRSEYLTKKKPLKLSITI